MNKRITQLLTAVCVTAASLTPHIPPVRADTTDTDPTYRVTVTQSGAEYTAHVTLENIAATYGTFGIKYDKTLFDFDPGGVKVADGLTSKYTPEQLTGGTWSDNGYYIFVWQAGDYDETVLDASGTPKDIADFKLTLKSGYTSDDLTLESITVMPWHKTREAIEFAKNLPPDDPLLNPTAYYSEYWRWTDAANDVPERGRLARDKAVIHGINTGGFYEVAVNAGLDEDGEPFYFYDVKTIVDYGDIDVKKSVIKFHVIDKETGGDIEGADINLYRAGTLIDGKRTDYMGETVYPTDITESAEYSYSVTKDGYCPVPLNGAAMPTVTTKAGESTLVTVELERGYKLKGYVDLGQGSNTSGNVQSGASVTFTRTDGETTREETSVDRNDAYFEATLPKGTWTVTVTKSGYVKYEITDFNFDPASEAEETLFADGKKITPYIGSAKTGTSVTFIDAAAVKTHMGETGGIGDVDDNGRVDATDMAYVLFNYGKRTITETYSDFLTKGAATPPEIRDFDPPKEGFLNLP